MRQVCLIVFILLCASMPAFADGHDYPGFGHIQGYSIRVYEERGFGSATLEAEPGQKMTVAGHTVSLGYVTGDAQNHASNLEVYLDYLAILKPYKAEILYSPADMSKENEHVLARFFRDSTPIYVNVKSDNDGYYYYIYIVEQKEFTPSVVTSPAK